MTIEEAMSGRNENIGRACVAYHQAASKLRRIHTVKREAQEAVEKAEHDARFQRDGTT